MADRFRTAGVCTRGHVLSRVCEAADPGERCGICGAPVIRACQACGTPIRGQREWLQFTAQLYEDSQPLTDTDWTPYDEEYVCPSFCQQCGEPYPWVGRQERIWEIENRLGLDGLDAGTALALREQLDALGEGQEDDDTQVKRWKRVSELVPGFLERSGVKEIAVTVMTEAAKKQLGL